MTHIRTHTHAHISGVQIIIQPIELMPPRPTPRCTKQKKKTIFFIPIPRHINLHNKFDNVSLWKCEWIKMKNKKMCLCVTENIENKQVLWCWCARNSRINNNRTDWIIQYTYCSTIQPRNPFKCASTQCTNSPACLWRRGGGGGAETQLFFFVDLFFLCNNRKSFWACAGRYVYKLKLFRYGVCVCLCSISYILPICYMKWNTHTHTRGGVQHAMQSLELQNRKIWNNTQRYCFAMFNASNIYAIFKTVTHTLCVCVCKYTCICEKGCVQSICRIFLGWLITLNVCCVYCSRQNEMHIPQSLRTSCCFIHP